MFDSRKLAPLLALSVFFTPDAALAAPSGPSSASPAFAEALSDAVLSEVRGGQTPFAPLTRNVATRMTEDQRYGDARLTASIVPVTFDIWFTEVASPMIAANTRAGL